MKTLALRPSAKINLTLHIGSTRGDGFHEVRSVMQSIDLADRLQIALERGPLRLIVRRRSRAIEIPDDPSNLVWRAAAALWRALGRAGEPHGVRLVLEKSIPTGAGLGGGSADAAATLAGLHRLWRGALSRAELLEVAAELGSDVPFFLVGGSVLALGRGEQVYPLADIARAGLVIIKPDLDVPTPAAYRWFDEDAGGGATPRGRTDDPAMLDVGWATGPLELRNDFHGPVARRHDVIGKAMAALRQQGARAVAMTGSGSAVFGVFAESATARAARRLTIPGWQVFATRTLTRREAGRRMALC